MVPSKLEKAEEELVEQQSRYDSITQLKPIKERVRSSSADIWKMFCYSDFKCFIMLALKSKHSSASGK